MSASDFYWRLELLVILACYNWTLNTYASLTVLEGTGRKAGCALKIFPVWWDTPSLVICSVQMHRQLFKSHFFLVAFLLSQTREMITTYFFALSKRRKNIFTLHLRHFSEYTEFFWHSQMCTESSRRTSWC